MIRFIDNQLNKITTYRLVLYVLIFLVGAGFLLSVSGQLSYNPWALLLSAGFLLAVSLITNRIFSAVYGVPANVESAYISALILALIITPIRSANDLWFLGWAAVLAMASKYLIVIRGRHLFNPAVFAITLTYYVLNQTASWWVGSVPMLPFVLPAGLLVVRRLGRFDLVLSFLAAAIGIAWIVDLITGSDPVSTLRQSLLSSALLFFAFFIVTEPLTTPPTRRLRMYYGAIVGLLFAPQLHIGPLYMTPELALLIGNIFSFIVSPKARFVLRLKERNRLSPDVYEFVFPAPAKFSFEPGQYMEWTLGHHDPDERGNRRYFTLASAPTEHNIRLGIKFDAKSSTFKKALLSSNRETILLASQLAGDFVLPEDPEQKCVFIAGGIGATPFRSMLKYLLDRRQRRPITMFYTSKTADDFVFKDVFDRAQKELGIRMIYNVTDNSNLPANWSGKVGRLTPEMIRTTVPDFRECIFYISGPRGLVDSFKDALGRLGVAGLQIKTDYFSGLA